MIRMIIIVLYTMILAAIFALIVSMAYSPSYRNHISDLIATNKDNINALSTLVIAVFTVCLWASTQGMLGVTKDSIDLVRREFYSLHRPKIRIKHLGLASDIWTNEQILVDLTFVNVGSVSAILSEVGLKVFIIKSDRLLPFEPRIDAIGSLPSGATVKPGLNHCIEKIASGITITDSQNSGIQSGKLKLYCVGYVSYLDELNNLRITGFSRILNVPDHILSLSGNCRFIKYEDSDYEYED